jgi:hypothetical protein
MDEKQKLRKRIRSVMIVFLVVIIPGYIRLFYSDAFDFVRAVDIVQLLATGILTGILIMTAKDYFRTTKQNQ